MQIETILSLLPTALVASLNSSIFSFVNFDFLSLRYDFIFIAELVWLFDHLGNLTREAKWLVEGTCLTDSSYRLSLVLVNGHDTFGFTLANIWSAILLSPVCWQLPHPPLGLNDGQKPAVALKSYCAMNFIQYCAFCNKCAVIHLAALAYC